MEISIHVNVKNPKTNQFPYLESIASYCKLADEVIVVDGGTTDGSIENIKKIDKKVRVIEYPWPDDWTWDQLAHSTRAGYEACSGDWAIKMDLDYVVHEDSVSNIRKHLQNMLDAPIPMMGATFNKVQFQLVDRYFAKSKSHLAINKRDWGYRLNYGVATREDMDFMWAVMVEGKTTGTDGNGLYYGTSIQEYSKFLAKVGPSILCYDCTFMTEEHLHKVRPQYDIARSRLVYLHKTQEEREKDAKRNTMEMLKRKFLSRKVNKQWVPLALEGHPKVMQERIKNMKSNMFGVNNFGWFGKEYSASYFR